MGFAASTCFGQLTCSTCATHWHVAQSVCGARALFKLHAGYAHVCKVRLGLARATDMPLMALAGMQGAGKGPPWSEDPSACTHDCSIEFECMHCAKCLASKPWFQGCSFVTALLVTGGLVSLLGDRKYIDRKMRFLALDVCRR